MAREAIDYSAICGAAVSMPREPLQPSMPVGLKAGVLKLCPLLYVVLFVRFAAHLSCYPFVHLASFFFLFFFGGGAAVISVKNPGEMQETGILKDVFYLEMLVELNNHYSFIILN